MKKLALLLATLLTLTSASVAQDNSRYDSSKVPDAVKVTVISAARVPYPIEAKMQRMTGTGVYQMNIDTKTGLVKSVTILKASGSRMLDATAVNTFSRWRFKPHTLSRATLPVTWKLP